MKAIVYEEFGPPEVLQVRDVPKPEPADDQVLIKIHGTSVTTGDANARGFVFVPPGLGPLARLMMGPTGPRKPILGGNLAGEIEAVGNVVTMFKEGDAVYGINGNDVGSYAEYVCWPESAALVSKPANLSFEEAAAIPFGGTTAYNFLHEMVDLQPGQRVLVNGASGAVGTAAVQIAKAYGAEVTGVCSGPNAELVLSLGADKVIDYTQEDFRKNGETYDIIFDMVVGQVSYSRSKDSLAPDGKYVAVAGGLREMVQMARTSLIGNKKVIFGGGMSAETKEIMHGLTELIEAGKFQAVIDKVYPLDQIVEAHRYVDTGHKKGNVVINVTGDTTK